jgi:hypothetical protein
MGSHSSPSGNLCVSASGLSLFAVPYSAAKIGKKEISTKYYTNFLLLLDD